MLECRMVRDARMCDVRDVRMCDVRDVRIYVGA